MDVVSAGGWRSHGQGVMKKCVCLSGILLFFEHWQRVASATQRTTNNVWNKNSKNKQTTWDFNLFRLTPVVLLLRRNNSRYDTRFPVALMVFWQVITVYSFVLPSILFRNCLPALNKIKKPTTDIISQI